MSLDYAPMDRQARLQSVRTALADSGCDALVVSKAENVRWLTGFTGSNGTVALSNDAFSLITDGRYTVQAAQELSAADVEAEIIIERDALGPIRDIVDSSARLGLESHDISWANQLRFAETFSDHELVPTVGLIEELRKIKDLGEIERLRLAADITDRALANIRSELAQGRSERAIAQLLEQTMRSFGADEASFPTIVASGPNSALPHASPTERTLANGDLVIIDVGARVDGYGSDMTRTFMIGSPSAEQQDLFDAVSRAQSAGVALVRSGVAASELDAICRQSLAGDHLEEAFLHGTGHGIGLEIHENPILSARTKETIRSGYVITIEPGAYVAGLGGVRIEDSVVVTDAGCDPITNSPKDPYVR